MRALLVVACLMTPFLAFADIPPQDSMDCRSKVAGATCKTDDGKSGTCKTVKRSRRDYGSGMPPKMIEVDMLICEAPKPADAGVRSEADSRSRLPLAFGVTALGLGALTSLALRRRKPRSLA
jgi:hypothetical protein